MGRKGAKMAMGKKDSTILLKVPKALKDALQALADDDARKLADYCRLVLIRHVEAQKGGPR